MSMRRSAYTKCGNEKTRTMIAAAVGAVVSTVISISRKSSRMRRKCLRMSRQKRFKGDCMMCAAWIRGDGKARRLPFRDLRRLGRKRRLDQLFDRVATEDAELLRRLGQ